MDWTMTFSSIELFLRPIAAAIPEKPTARIAMGIAVSNTWAILRPRYAAAAEKIAVNISPRSTDLSVTSGSF